MKRNDINKWIMRKRKKERYNILLSLISHKLNFRDRIENEKKYTGECVSVHEL